MYRSVKMVPPAPAMRRMALGIAAVAIAMTAAGCKSMNSKKHTSALPLGYEERNPITVGYQPVGIVVYADPYARGLSAQDATEVAALARQYRNTGQGVIYLQAPSGSGAESVVHASAAQIRQIFGQEGIDPSVLSVHTYRSEGGYGPVPMKLVFYRYSAEAGPCGEWPKNLSRNPGNLEYDNFGCAAQRNLAAMVEDPRDLLGPRGDGPRDAMRRATVQDKYRKGEDSSTVYTDQGATVSEVGGQ